LAARECADLVGGIGPLKIDRDPSGQLPGGQLNRT